MTSYPILWAWQYPVVLCTLQYSSSLRLPQEGIMDHTPAEPPNISDQSTVLSSPSSGSRGFSISSTSSNGGSQLGMKSSAGDPAQQFQPIIRLLRLYLKYLDKHPVATKAVTRCCTALEEQSDYLLNTDHEDACEMTATSPAVSLELLN